MTTFFTADTHFGHQNIIKYEDRPFDSVEEMNDELVRRWNSVVQDKDTVFVLGDVVMGGVDKNIHNISRLNGQKIMLSGNHDKTFYTSASNDKTIRKAVRSLSKYIDAGFAVVYTGAPARHTVIGGTQVSMSHFPYEGDHTDEDRYSEARPKDRGQWLIHGHVHGLWRIKGRQINVGVDVWNGYPVPANAIENIMTSATFRQAMIDSYESDGGWRQR